MIARYRTLHIARENHITALINVYENHLQRLQDNPSLLTSEQKNNVKVEMEHFKSVCNLGFRTGGLLDDNKEISATLFRDMVQQLEEKCPFINEILETLLCFSEKDRNKNKTHTMKMKCASHALSSLVALANQKFPNDLQLFFGLLCISYGSGKQFINMLSSIGLSLHWDSL